MGSQGKLITGLIVGAGAMYLLDPDRGPRRRSLLRDQGIHLGHKLGDGLAASARDTKNRTVGAAAGLRGRLSRDDAGDEVIEDRIRSALGRIVSHPGAVTVTVFDGRVTLSGQVLAEEMDTLIRGVSRVRGVRDVQNQLEMYATAHGVPSLQGESHAGERSSPTPDPGTRLMLGTVGGLLALKGSRTRGVPGRVMSAVGLGLVARAASNFRPNALVELGLGRREVQIEKTLHLAAPTEQVWELWANFENFPRFMAHLREVRKIDEERSHWVAEGPAGTPVEWDAIITDWVPGQFIGWTSLEGSAVETSGQVRLRPLSESETQLDVQLSYNPPAGAAGHALASLLGVDPKRAMDDDLARFKSLIEDQKTPTPGGPSKTSKRGPRKKR
jgi:uncharacterized membrane protein